MAKQIYLKNATVLTMDDRDQVYAGGGVLIEGDRIKAT